MKTALMLVPVGGLALAVALVFLRARGKSADSGVGVWPFHVRKPLTAPEQVLYFRLLEALPEHIVLAQVQLSRFLGVNRGESARRWLNRINRLSVDFLVLKQDASVIAAIELDDKSHERHDRREADGRKNRALADAHVPLLRWNVARMPSREQIQAELATSAAGKGSSDRAGRVEPTFAEARSRDPRPEPLAARPQQAD